MVDSFQDIVKEKSDEELLIMVYQFDQWNSEMQEAVQSELAKRHMLPGDISIRKQKIIEIETEDLKRGERSKFSRTNCRMGLEFWEYWDLLSGIIMLFQNQEVNTPAKNSTHMMKHPVKTEDIFSIYH